MKKIIFTIFAVIDRSGFADYLTNVCQKSEVILFVFMVKRM